MHFKTPRATWEDSDRLMVTVEVRKQGIPVLFMVLFGLLGGLVMRMQVMEMIGIALFLIIVFFFTLLSAYQVTELHFDKKEKTLYVAYSLFGKILKKRKLLDDYTAYHYSIHLEEAEDFKQVYALRATGVYYYYDLHYFVTFGDAELIRQFLGKKLGLTLQEAENDAAPDETLP